MGPDPVLHLLAGPTGSGKSTYATKILQPVTHLRFVNADVIAAERDKLLAAGVSFITETVFSHPSKVDLVTAARDAGYLVHLHVMLLPEDVCVARVLSRVDQGGHSVPEEKIRQRYRRLWTLVVQARNIAERTQVYDNSRAGTAFKPVATYENGALIGEAIWPTWAPGDLTH